MIIAVYAGSFDPITSGHLSIIRQAARIFAHVRVLVAVNPNKQGTFALDERVRMARDAVAKLPNVSVDQTTGLVVEYADAIAASVLIRGVRGASDAEGETRLAQQNRSLAPQISTILLPAEPRLAAVSSSALKRMAKAGDDISRFCSPFVSAQLARKYRKVVAS